jgi:hypothetical protein
MPNYEIKPEPDSPIWWVFKDGVHHRDFTSRTGAQAYLDHVLKHGEQTRLQPRIIVAGNVSNAFKAKLERALNGKTPR